MYRLESANGPQSGHCSGRCHQSRFNRRLRVVAGRPAKMPPLTPQRLEPAAGRPSRSRPQRRAARFIPGKPCHDSGELQHAFTNSARHEIAAHRSGAPPAPGDARAEGDVAACTLFDSLFERAQAIADSAERVCLHARGQREGEHKTRRENLLFVRRHGRPFSSVAVRFRPRKACDANY